MDRQASIVSIPSIVFVVGGTIGVGGLVSFVDVGIDQVSQMFVTALFIADGLLVGRLVLPPKSTL